ncbi:MAG TPA: hypothetical protein ENK06_12940 [Gammaproteobacteria bacterium]|nr:hypothetical protein [Gammaproteobacteria bacterium]
MKSGKLVVRKNTFLSSKGGYAFFLLILVFVGLGAYYLGQFRAGYNLFETMEAEAEWHASMKSLEQSRQDLKDKLAIAARSRQVEDEAHQRVKSDLKALQREIVELQEEVDFYRGIVAPRESSEGIRIDQFDLKASNFGRLYHFSLVLTQVKKNQRYIRGVAELFVEGEQNGQPKKLELKRISADKLKDLKFKFRYFQKLEGDIVLPEGFNPRQVVVKVSPRKKKQIRRFFEWFNLVPIKSTEMQKQD